MLALAEEIQALFELAQAACDDYLCLLMLAGECTLHFCHPSHYSRTPRKSFPCFLVHGGVSPMPWILKICVVYFNPWQPASSMFLLTRAEYNEDKLTLAINRRNRWDIGCCNLTAIYFKYSIIVMSSPKLLVEVGLNS